MTPSYDAHIHIWERQYQEMVVGTGRAGESDQLRLMLALMDGHGIERACVVAACGETHPGNNDFVAAICRKHPDRFSMLSEIPLLSGHRDELLERTLNDWPARGFRCRLREDEHPDDWCGPSHEALWERANEAGLRVALNIGPDHAARLVSLVRKYPGITWILDHMGRPRHDMAEDAFRPVLDLASFDNVAVKVSAFYAFTADPVEYPYKDLARFVTLLRDAFGPRRLMWASDAPPALEYGSYAHTYRCLDHLPQLGPDDRKWIFGGTARRVLG